jgi:hypothetical protein
LTLLIALLTLLLDSLSLPQPAPPTAAIAKTAAAAPRRPLRANLLDWPDMSSFLSAGSTDAPPAPELY